MYTVFNGSDALPPARTFYKDILSAFIIILVCYIN